MSGPLSGIKVLDLTRVLAGPYATMIMGDMGAEIVKIEAPGLGDDSRQFGPHVGTESAYFMSLNRNKRSLTLNLKHPKGKTLFLELVKKTDLVVENFRPGTMEKLGLGYEDLKTVNPRVIYGACSGFGHTGPYSHRAAYDAIVQAMGGIMSITGELDGKPTRVGPSIGDITAGLFTTIGLLTALYYRDRTGKGQKIDVAMLDCQVAILENAIARYVVTGKNPKPLGNRHNSIVPFETFETSDGEIMIAAGNDELWKRLCEVIGFPELAIDKRFSTNPLRNEHYQILRPLLGGILKEKPCSHWMERLEEAGIPNGPINCIGEVIENPQVQAREMIIEVDHPKAGQLKMAGVPVKLSESPGGIQKPAPLLGEHSKEILMEWLGYSEAEVNCLREEGVL